MLKLSSTFSACCPDGPEQGAVGAFRHKLLNLHEALSISAKAAKKCQVLPIVAAKSLARSHLAEHGQIFCERV